MAGYKVGIKMADAIADNAVAFTLHGGKKEVWCSDFRNS